MLRPAFCAAILFALFIGCHSSSNTKSSSSLYPNEVKTTVIDGDTVYVVAEKMPKIKGGLQSVQENLKYPERARERGIQGRVIVQFIVNKKGKAENYKVIRNIGAGCGKAAIRAIQRARFEPGEVNGEPVEVLFSLPVTFSFS